MRLLAAVLLGSTVVGYGVPAALAQAQRPAAPGTDCLDARQVAELHQAGARTLAIAERDGRLFRLQFSQDCPHLAAQPDASLVAANGWVCNGAQASVSTGQQRCAIDQVATLKARDYASLARQRDHDGVPLLDGISVREARRHNFTGSSSGYSSDCFNPSMLRSWSEDAQGLVVEVSPRHPGTHRHYRVELMDSCRELSGAPPIRFVSGMGLNAICGNAGDKVDVLNAIGIAGARVGAGAEGDLSSVRRHVLAHAAELHGGGSVSARLAQPAFSAPSASARPSERHRTLAASRCWMQRYRDDRIARMRAHTLANRASPLEAATRMDKAVVSAAWTGSGGATNEWNMPYRAPTAPA